MKNQAWAFLKRSMQAAVELIAFFPLILMLAVFAFPESVVLSWVAFLVVYYIAGILLRTVLRKKPKIASVLLGVIITFSLAYSVFGWGLPLWASYSAGVVLLFRGMSFVERRWEEVFPSAALWVGILIYFVAYFFYKHSMTLMPYAGLVARMGFIYTGISLIIFNLQQLKRATLSRNGEPVLSSGLLRHNRLLIALTFILIGIVANLSRLKEAVLWLVNAIILLIVKVILFLSNLVPMSEPGGEMPPDGGMLDMLPEAEPRAPNIFDYIFEVLAYVLSIAFVIALVAALAMMLYRVMRRLIKLLARLIQEGEWMGTDAGYVDVKEKVIDLKTLGKEYASRWKHWLTSLIEREPRWEDLSDVTQKVRYLYRRFLIRCISLGYRPKSYMTPNEINEDLKVWNERKGRQADVLIPLYNLVKYGKDAEKLIDHRSLDELADMIDKRFGD